MGLEASSDGPSWTSREKNSMHVPCWGHSTWEGNTSQHQLLFRQQYAIATSLQHSTLRSQYLNSAFIQMCAQTHPHCIHCPLPLQSGSTWLYRVSRLLLSIWMGHRVTKPQQLQYKPAWDARSFLQRLAAYHSSIALAAFWGGWEASSAVPTPVSARSPTAEHAHPHSHRGAAETNMVSTDLSEEKPANTFLPTSGKLPQLSQPPLPPPALGSSPSPSKLQWLLYIHLGLWIIWFPLVACKEETK